MFSVCPLWIVSRKGYIRKLYTFYVDLLVVLTLSAVAEALSETKAKGNHPCGVEPADILAGLIPQGFLVGKDRLLGTTNRLSFRVKRGTPVRLITQESG